MAETKVYVILDNITYSDAPRIQLARGSYGVRNYSSIKAAKRNNPNLGEEDDNSILSVIILENLQPAEMTDEQAYTWHETQMLYHATEADAFKRRLSTSS